MVFIRVFGAGYAGCWTYNTNFLTWVHGNFLCFGPRKLFSRKTHEACHCEKLKTWHMLDRLQYLIRMMDIIIGEVSPFFSIHEN